MQTKSQHLYFTHLLLKLKSSQLSEPYYLNLWVKPIILFPNGKQTLFITLDYPNISII